MLRICTLILFLLLSQSPLTAQDASPEERREMMASYIDSLFQSGLQKKLIPGGVVALTGTDRPLLQKAYGYADVGGQTKADFDSTLFQIGSIGKTFTAIAVMQQVEEGRLDLNRDIQSYLENPGIDNPYAEPLTLTQLLTHTAGFNDRNIGYLMRSSEDLQPLGTYLEHNLPTLFQKPGTSINYSNFGYGLAGYLVEVSSGMDFRQYVGEHILDALEMAQTTYRLPDNYRSLPRYAKGYEVRNEFNEVVSYPRNLWPAGSLLSTGEDMTRFLQMLLQKHRLLKTDSFSRIFRQQFTNHPALPGVTFGFEEQFINGRRFIAKGGQVSGFLSLMVLFPEESLALFISVNTETDNFLREFITGFTDRFFPNTGTETNHSEASIPGHVEGAYRNQRANHRTIEELFSMMMSHKKVVRLDENRLGVVRGNRFIRYRPAGDSVFYSMDNPQNRIVFAGSPTKIERLFTSESVGGLQVPASFSKVPWIYSPDTVNDIYPWLLLPIPLYLLVLIFLPVSYWFKQWRGSPKKANTLWYPVHLSALAFSGLVIWDITGFFVPLISLITSGELLFGLPEYLLDYKYLHWAMAGVLTLVLSGAISIWITKQSRLLVRIGYTVYALSSLFYIWLLIKWHFFDVVM